MSAGDLPTSPKKQTPIGIDLGTTYSVVAYLDATGRPTTVLNGTGDLLTPSALSSTRTAWSWARKRSRTVFVPDLRRMLQAGHGSEWPPQIRGSEVPPEVLSAFVLERLKQDAEGGLGPVRQVVITVPGLLRRNPA